MSENLNFYLSFSFFFIISMLLGFLGTTKSDEPCPYPCYPSPTGTGSTGTPSIPSGTAGAPPPPPPSQTTPYQSPPGYYPYYNPPTPFGGGGGGFNGSPPPPDPILPYFPFYYRKPPHQTDDQSSSSSATVHEKWSLIITATVTLSSCVLISI